MSQIQSKDNQYFLTRQTANLREDFVRELTNNESLFLLYGESLVGKSRFLKELISTNLKEHEVHWIDFRGVEESDKPSYLTSEVDRILNAASTHQVVVVDHFEMATNKLKHQIIQSWSTDGIDKKFSLIIVTVPDEFDEVCQLASQYRVDIKSFRLMPFTKDEIDDFCASTLFPSLLPNPLTLSKQLRQVLNETRGVVGMLRKVVEQESDKISMEAKVKPVSILKPLFVIVGLTIVFVSIGLVTYFLPVNSVDLQALNQSVEKQTVNGQTKRNQTEGSVDKVEIEEKLSPITEDVILELVIAEQISAEPELIEVMDKPIIVQEQVQLNEAEEVTTIKGESTKLGSLKDIDEIEPYSYWFQNELKRSRKWLKSSDRSHATIQIMSIGFNSVTDEAYFNYIETLKKRNVDVSRIRVYPTKVRDNIMFSVVYGEYDSRGDARKSVPNLPLSLKANQPITRTIGGIWNEINTL